MKKITLIISILLLSNQLFSQKKLTADTINLLKTETLAGLKFRSIGPALTSGRISDFAVNPNNNSEYYVASSAGGVWKTLKLDSTNLVVLLWNTKQKVDNR